MPVPVSAPEPRGVPFFAPLRVRGGRQRLRRALRRRHRALSAGLVVTAAALVAWAPSDREATQPPDAPPAHAARAAPDADDHRPVVRAGGANARRTAVVSAPVRIADAATVRLLEPGDRVDVIATPDLDPAPSAGKTAAEARVVATGVRVTGVPDAGSASPTGDGGALIVLAVSRSTATALIGAAAHSDLAVILC